MELIGTGILQVVGRMLPTFHPLASFFLDPLRIHKGSAITAFMPALCYSLFHITS